MKKSIYITAFDLRRFKWLINNAARFDQLYRTNIQKLEEELKEALVVEPKEIPPNIITMHTTFKIKDSLTDNKYIYTLVFPFDANAEQNKISIVTNIGVSTIGAGSGDVVKYKDENGIRSIEIEEIIYQPEREGLYYF